MSDPTKAAQGLSTANKTQSLQALNEETHMNDNCLIVIRTYDELLEREQELLERISTLPNGGQLYLIHPLLVFADVGAELAPDVQEEFAAQHGGSGGWSEEPYRALRESVSKQPIQVTLRGLFRRPL